MSAATAPAPRPSGASSGHCPPTTRGERASSAACAPTTSRSGPSTLRYAIPSGAGRTVTRRERAAASIRATTDAASSSAATRAAARPRRPDAEPAQQRADPPVHLRPVRQGQGGGGLHHRDRVPLPDHPVLQGGHRRRHLVHQRPRQPHEPVPQRWGLPPRQRHLRAHRPRHIPRRHRSREHRSASVARACTADERPSPAPAPRPGPPAPDHPTPPHPPRPASPERHHRPDHTRGTGPGHLRTGLRHTGIRVADPPRHHLSPAMRKPYRRPPTPRPSQRPCGQPPPPPRPVDDGYRVAGPPSMSPRSLWERRLSTPPPHWAVPAQDGVSMDKESCFSVKPLVAKVPKSGRRALGKSEPRPSRALTDHPRQKVRVFSMRKRTIPPPRHIAWVSSQSRPRPTPRG